MGLGVGELAILALVGFIFVGLVNGRRHGRLAAVGLGVAFVLVALFCLRSGMPVQGGAPLTVRGLLPWGSHDAVPVQATLEQPQAQLAIVPVIFLAVLAVGALALLFLAAQALARSKHGGTVLAILMLPIGLVAFLGGLIFLSYSRVETATPAMVVGPLPPREVDSELMLPMPAEGSLEFAPPPGSAPGSAQPEGQLDAPAVAPPTEEQLAATMQLPTPVEAEPGAEALPPDAASPTDSAFASSIPAAAPASPPSDERPAWVDAPPRPQNGEFQVKTIIGPYPDEAGCETALQDELVRFYRDYILQRYGPDAAALLAPASGVVLRSQLVRQHWLEPLESPSLGRMWQLHVLIEISAARQTELAQQVQAAFSQRRAQRVLLGAGAVFSILGALFACLKLDTLTRGYYTGRLRLGAAVVIGAVVAAAALLS